MVGFRNVTAAFETLPPREKEIQIYAKKFSEYISREWRIACWACIVLQTRLDILGEF